MEFKYFQFASPFYQFPRAITTSEYVDNFWDESKSKNTGRSWQFFDESLMDYQKLNGSTSGYRAKSYSPIVPIDIDDANVDNLKNILNKLNGLIGDFELVDLYFSGKKGYHIEIPSGYFGIKSSENLPERFKRMVSAMNIGADLSLYKQSQLYRMNNSYNEDGGYYKTQLDIEDIFDGIKLNDIKELSLKPTAQSFEMYEKPEIESREWLIELWETSECPDNTKLHVNGGVPKGKRNENAYDTALSLKTQEYPRETAYGIVMAQNKKNNPPEPNMETLLRSVDSAYNGDYWKKFSIDPILQQIKEDAYFHELNWRQRGIIINMLIEANIRENVFKGERIKRNQLVYGKKTTAKRWRINENTLVSILNKFEKDGIISKQVIKEDGKYSFTIITLLTFDVTQHFTHIFNEQK